MSILKLKSGERAAGMLAYCFENKNGQDSEVERCTEFRNSYGFDNYEDVSHAWTMERQGCGKEKGRQYYHATLSIDPSDPRASSLTDKEIGDMGEIFVKDFAPDHAYAVFVHRDEKHPHVHVLWNSVNLETGKKFHLSNADLEKSQIIKEQVDKEFGITSTPIKKAELQQDRVPPEVLRILERTETAYIWTEDLKQRIASVANESDNISDFSSRMKTAGVDVTERGSEKKFTYSFLDHDGKQRKVRQDKLGENYGRESLNTEIEQRLEREFSQRESSKQLSIKHISDLSTSGSAVLGTSYAWRERSNSNQENGRGVENSFGEGDYSTRSESLNGRAQVAIERLPGILSGNDEASFHRRSSENEHKPSDRSHEFEQNHSGIDIKSAFGNNFSYVGVLSTASENAKAAREYGRDSFEVPERTKHENGIDMSEYGSDGRFRKEVGREYQSRVNQSIERESPNRDVEDSFLRGNGGRDRSLAYSGRVLDDISGLQGNTRFFQERPRLLSNRVTDNRSITDQVKEITVNMIEHIKEWRSRVSGKLTDKSDRSRDGFYQHTEQGRNSSLYERMQKELSGSDYFSRENASERVSGNKRNSSERISQCARDSSERIEEYERNSSKSHHIFELSTGKDLKQSVDDSSERTRQFERDIRSGTEKTFREYEKFARDITAKSQDFGRQIDAKKQDEMKKSNERSQVVKRSRGYEMEM